MSGLRLGYLGPEGSFSHEACRRWAERAGVNGARLVGLPSLDRLFEAASRGEVDQIVCPLENSLEGSVAAAVDLWLHQSALFQVGELVLPVEHVLAARPGVALRELQAVLSHPHALAQCRRTLRHLVPWAELRGVSSTAEAARQVATGQAPWGAVASREAAARYGLAVLHAPVQDGQQNATRFAALGWQLPAPTGRDRTSLVVGSLEDRPGLLRDLLAEFAQRQLNLTRIESRPSREGLGRYLFLIDLEGHVQEPAVRDALRGVRRWVGYLRLLGSYPRWDNGGPAAGPKP